MQITDVRLRKVNSENRMKAVASVTFDNEFVIHDIKVIESQNGLFIAMKSSIEKELEEEIISDTVSRLRNRLYQNDFWIVDYVRIQFRAVKQQNL